MVKKVQVEEEIFEVTVHSTLEQAVNTLFLAASKADYANDVDSLMRIAAGWMELHEYLAGRPEDKKSIPLGFTGGLRHDDRAGHEPDDDSDLADAIATESES